MAAYRLVDMAVTCGLTACTPGSAPGPTLGNEYGKTLHILTINFIWGGGSGVMQTSELGTCPSI